MYLTNRVFSLGAGAYRSFKLMKRGIDKKRGKPVSERYHFIEDDEESVLMFWSIFGVITFIQEYMEVFLSWIPLYYVSKCVLLAFLSTSTEGSRFLFKFVSPIVNTQADAYVPRIQSKASQFIRKIHQALIRLVLEGADAEELERLQKTLQRQLHDIKLLREKDSSSSSSSSVSESSRKEESKKTTVASRVYPEDTKRM